MRIQAQGTAAQSDRPHRLRPVRYREPRARASRFAYVQSRARSVFTSPPSAVAAALRGLRAAQALQQSTGAAHAAAWCSPDGDAVLLREDIGRHNALDKLAGAMSRAKLDASEGFVCVTSRASFEMVQKTAMIGASMLVAVSAPTVLAVRTAQAAGLALAGFARREDFVAYTDPERFGLAL